MRLRPVHVVAGVVIAGVAGALYYHRTGRRPFAVNALKPLENPGGGRIQDKRDPDPEMLIEVAGVGGQRLQVHRDAWTAYEAMRDAAHADGIDKRRLGVHSAYRPSSLQARLFKKAVERYGSESAARKWVAPPGSSAHQSGRALDLDLDGGTIGSGGVSRMRKSAAYAWLIANAGRFGFYPYGAEPWHWEYNPPA